ncbi:hypothetical protein N7478_007494 [Penicillium angulare]|uniref:uncharacterized protein n=1 Tax=Penicillium angulare TaxID=116970 RepID=UPI002541B51A|nr:uncharacterized protein N7478_007494 [Penicillium angulare]KAJ5272369.1 hypothetical protein N7478_007494 [Penicillium angulare]
MEESNVELYTSSTLSGVKVSIALEELGIPYEFEHLDISTNRQKKPWFLEINLKGRIPAVTDTLADSTDVVIFDSGSILLYLAEQYDKDHNISFLVGSAEHCEMINWLFFQNAGVGPMQG